MIVFWLCGMLSGKVALLVALAGITIIVLSHTRTALVGMLAGLLVAGLSLIVIKSRARKFFAGAGVVVSIGVITAAGRRDELARTWAERSRASVSYRTDRLLAPGSRTAAYQVPGDLRLRPVERIDQWPPNRQ